MGKGKRNVRKNYRIVVHSAEYYRKQRELKTKRQRAKDIRDGNIFFDGEAELELKVELNPLGKPILLALSKKKEPNGVRC